MRSVCTPIQLPNPASLWSWGMALAPYSKPFSESRGPSDRYSDLGNHVHFYKYQTMLTDEQRLAAALEVTNVVDRFIIREFEYKFPDSHRPPFDACIAAPNNRRGGHSLPNQICQSLGQIHPWLTDRSGDLTKTRCLPVMKELRREERSTALTNGYAIRTPIPPPPRFGVLILDDVFETGSTVSAICQALELAYPSIPRYVIAVTHVLKPISSESS